MSSATLTGTHVPVLRDEVLRHWWTTPDGLYVDATFGRGGHARAILERLGPRGRLLVFDRDPEAVASALALAEADPRVTVVPAPFAALGCHVAPASAAGVLFDLGVSSPQLDTPERGFSFVHDGPLDMRMDPGGGPSAAEWLAMATEAELARVLADFGEEPRARAVARAIVARRQRAPFTRTSDLAACIAEHAARVPGRHPATRSFQALRMQVNDELGQLERALPQALDALRSGGRLAVISFHSLEDRVVKRFIRAQSRPPAASRRGPPPAAFVARLRELGKYRASAAECAANPRARSAVLRIAEVAR